MAYCGNCGTRLENEKFCPNCGMACRASAEKSVVRTRIQMAAEKNQWTPAIITISAIMLVIILILVYTSGSNTIVGRWKAGNDYSGSENVEFFRDGTFTWTSYGYSMDSFSGKYSVQGNVLNMESPSYGTLSLNFKRDGDTLILESAGGDSIYFHKVR